MDVSIISGQLALLHVRLEPGDGFEVYGGTSEDGLRVERQGDSEWLVTFDEQDVAGRPLVRYNLYARQLSSGREWAILGGKLMVSQRTATVPGDKLAPVEYIVTVPVLENAVDLTGTALVTGIVGPRGYSAYEVAVLEGFVGSEAEWLESIRQQTATLAVEQVTPLMERAETAADKSESEAAAAKTEKETAAAHAKAAKESELAAAEHKTAAAGEVTKAAAEVTKAAAEVEKAKLERKTAAEHATAAAKSAQAALANQQAAEQAAQDAQTAKSGAEQAAANADASKSAAQTAEGNAKASADAAAADKAAAEQARQDAQAAQSTAEEQARIATAAAEAAQAPESIAAQAARPATMLLVRDELMSILGDASLFVLDTDGQKIIVHTDRLNDEQLAEVTDMLARFVPQFIEVVQYNHSIEVSWRDINKYDACETVADVRAVNPDYKNDLTSDGEWVYPLSSLKSAGSSENPLFGNAENLKKIKLILPKATDIGWIFWIKNSTLLDEVYIEAPLVTGKNNSCYHVIQGTIKPSRLHLVLPNAEDISQLVWNTGQRHVELYAPKVRIAGLAFNEAQLEKNSAISILSGLPPYTDGLSHLITMGIHVDHQDDVEVLAAIDAATAKGWTVERQWNGTATAATFALRPLPPLPVYAKVGDYEDAGGNAQQVLNWCHGVTSPDGREPEELGYTLFESVESAYEYFGLSVPEDPYYQPQQNDEI